MVAEEPCCVWRSICVYEAIDRSHERHYCEQALVDIGGVDHLLLWAEHMEILSEIHLVPSLPENFHKWLYHKVVQD